MEVLEIQRIVPYLVNCGTVESLLSHLELERKDNRSDDQHDIYASTHPWNAKLEEYRP